MLRKIWRLAKKKLKKRAYRRVVQEHHISYDPEIIVKNYKGEHWVTEQMKRRTHVTVGFIVCLKMWLREHEKRAIDLSPKKRDSRLKEKMEKFGYDVKLVIKDGIPK